MILTVSSGDVEDAAVDRDSTSDPATGREGLDLYLGPLAIHFDDEEDAARVARLILARLGR